MKGLKCVIILGTLLSMTLCAMVPKDSKVQTDEGIGDPVEYRKSLYYSRAEVLRRRAHRNARKKKAALDKVEPEVSDKRTVIGKHGAYILSSEVNESGRTSLVYKAVRRGEKEYFAVKIGKKTFLEPELKMMKEVEKMKCGGLVSLVDHADLPDQKMFIVTPWYLGTLKDYLNFEAVKNRVDVLKKDMLYERRINAIKYILPDANRALRCLHFHKIVHRDVKAENIMYGMRNGNPYGVLLDLGNAIEEGAEQQLYFTRKCGDKFPVENGSVETQAPENDGCTWLNRKMDRETYPALRYSDMWSMGQIMLQTLDVLYVKESGGRLAIKTTGDVLRYDIWSDEEIEVHHEALLKELDTMETDERNSAAVEFNRLRHSLKEAIARSLAPVGKAKNRDYIFGEEDTRLKLSRVVSPLKFILGDSLTEPEPELGPKSMRGASHKSLKPTLSVEVDGEVAGLTSQVSTHVSPVFSPRNSPVPGETFSLEEKGPHDVDTFSGTSAVSHSSFRFVAAKDTIFPAAATPDSGL